MDRISFEEHRKIMLEMLNAFNKYCIENGIKYSLHGGSLIGAIRHKGIIPWDDDIDVVLMPDEYEKLINCLKVIPFKYKLIGYNNDNDYYNPGFKFVDESTIIEEKGLKRNYGVFIDVFRYNYIPDNFLLEKLYLVRFKYMIYIIHGFSPISKNTKNILKKVRNLYSQQLDNKKYLDKFYNFLNKYNKKPTGHVILNSTMYSIKNEVQDSENMKEYEKTSFNGVDTMIFKNYDNILRVTYGDYMTPPPPEKQICKHEIIVYKK